MTRRLLATLAAFTLAAVPGTGHAAHLAMFGTGTFSPGIPTTGCAFQTVSFSATVVSTPASTGSAMFNGNSSVCETLAFGAGGGTFSGSFASRRRTPAPTS